MTKLNFTCPNSNPYCETSYCSRRPSRRPSRTKTEGVLEQKQKAVLKESSRTKTEHYPFLRVFNVFPMKVCSRSLLEQKGFTTDFLLEQKRQSARSKKLF